MCKTWFKSPDTSMGQKHDLTPSLNLSFTKACCGFPVPLLYREPRKGIKNTKSCPILKFQKFPIHFAGYFKGQILKILMKKKIQDQILTLIKKPSHRSSRECDCTQFL